MPQLLAHGSHFRYALVAVLRGQVPGAALALRPRRRRQLGIPVTLAVVAATVSAVTPTGWAPRALSFLSIVGLYSLYLRYLGVPIFMEVSADRALTPTVAVVVVAAVIFLVVGAVTAAVSGLGAAV